MDCGYADVTHEENKLISLAASVVKKKMLRSFCMHVSVIVNFAGEWGLYTNVTKISHNALLSK